MDYRIYHENFLNVRAAKDHVEHLTQLSFVDETLPLVKWSTKSILR